MLQRVPPRYNQASILARRLDALSRYEQPEAEKETEPSFKPEVDRQIVIDINSLTIQQSRLELPSLHSPDSLFAAVAHAWCRVSNSEGESGWVPARTVEEL